MDVLQAKLDVIKAGKLLCEKGLIQRTWGNVSCRLDSDSFAVTPSGKAYDSLTPEDIVIVNIASLAYEGNIKPSSEKAVHAACYALRPEVNFVIHTHQTYASLAGLSGCDINSVDSESAAVIGSDIPLAAYGLPGTKALRNGVAAAVKRSSSRAVLMHRHGAVCMGSSLEDAFAVANELEKVCKKLLLNKYKELTGKAADCFNSLCEYIAAGLTQDTVCDNMPAYNSERNFGVFELIPEGNGKSVTCDVESGKPLDTDMECPQAAALHGMIYRKRKDINVILHSTDASVLAASKTGLTVKPFLDDFAQIVGISLKNAEFDTLHSLRSAKSIVNKLKHRNAVLIKHNGALCTGSSKDEAQAVKTVAEKGCRAFIAANAFGRQKDAVGVIEAAIMRFVYKTKYSKKK